MAKKSFEPDEPLPAFTYPAIDEATKAELLKAVEEANAKTIVNAPSVPVVAVPVVAAPVAPTVSAPLPPTAPAPEEATGSKLQATGSEVVPAGPRVTAARRFDVAELLSELRRIYGAAWRWLSTFVLRSIDAACGFIDRNRSKLPSRVRDPLGKVSSKTILAIAVGLAFACMALALSLGGGRPAERHDAVPASSAAAPAPLPPETDTVDREIEGAKQQGIGGLEKLAESLPNDPRVWLALAVEDSSKGIHPGAVAAVGKALAANPKAADDEQASTVLATAVRKRDTTDAAFEMLQGPMGASGAAVLYELSIDPEVKTSLRTRAEEWVRSDAFKKVAAPDVEIAAGLRYAKSCSDRHDLLARAGETGGKRVLGYLNIAKTPGGCGRRGRDDCFPCLRKDDALKDAIAAIEKRLANQ